MSNAFTPTQTLKLVSDGFVEMIDKASHFVVSVGSGMGRGSGVVWSPDGYIVTCSHVIGRHSGVTVRFEDEKIYEAKVVGQDPYSDVALLKVENDALKAIEQGDSEDLRVGSLVLALANPFSQRTSATMGIVTSAGSSLRGWGGMTMENVIITDAKLNPGYSGGPLLDVSGKMVGLNTASVRSRGIAIPISTLKNVVDNLLHEGKIRRAYLGIVTNTIELPKEITAHEATGQDSGVIVLAVENESPAKQAGLKLGDVIVKFDENPVASIYDLPKLLTKDAIGKETKLRVLRAEELMELTVTPIEARSIMNR